MKKLKNSLLILSVILITGCSNNILTHSFVEEPVFHPQLPRPIAFREITWEVYNKKELKKEIEKADSLNKDIPMISLSPEEYGDLMLNYQEVIRYVSQLKALVIFYREDRNL